MNRCNKCRKSLMLTTDSLCFECQRTENGEKERKNKIYEKILEGQEVRLGQRHCECGRVLTNSNYAVCDGCHKKLVTEQISQGQQWVDELPKSKYHREILPGVWVDVYDVLRAFKVTDSAMAHAIKKQLNMGIRGHKDEAEDRKDILDSVVRSNDQFKLWNEEK